MNKYLKSIDEKRKKKLQKILDYINVELEEEISIASLLAYIVDEFKAPVKHRECLNDGICGRLYILSRSNRIFLRKEGIYSLC